MGLQNPSESQTTSNELQTVLNNILTDKNTNLKPENIKKGVTCLGVTGTLEASTSSGGVKQFSTVEEMNSSTGNTEGDLAIVYSLNMRNIQQGETITNTLLFPDTVTFDATVNIEFSINGDLPIDNDVLEFTLTSDKCYINSVGSEFCRIVYDSTDGKIYTKTSSTVSGISVTNLTVPELDEYLYSFVQIAIASFKGIYKYNGTSWELAPTDLATVADEVYLTKFYGKNGVETGTLGDEISTSTGFINSVELYDKLETINIDKDINLNNVLYNSNIQSLPKINVDSAINIGGLCNKCTNLINASTINAPNVTTANAIFNQCSSMITAPEIILPKATITRHILSHCTSLVNVPVYDFPLATNLDNMFYNDTALSDESLNNIMQTCINLTAFTAIGKNLTLKYIGLTEEQANKCKTLSNYSAFTAAGWTTGY